MKTEDHRKSLCFKWLALVLLLSSCVSSHEGETSFDASVDPLDFGFAYRAYPYSCSYLWYSFTTDGRRNMVGYFPLEKEKEPEFEAFPIVHPTKESFLQVKEGMTVGEMVTLLGLATRAA